MRFANDKVNLETKHICHPRWQLSWHCDNYLILCLTKQTRKSHEVCQPFVILCWYHLKNLGLHNKTKDISWKPCINVVWTQGKPFKFYKSIRQNQKNLTFKEVFMCNLSFMSFDIFFWINHNIKHKFELYWLVKRFVKWQLLENKVVENPNMPKKFVIRYHNFTSDLFNFKKACKNF
jgi:hypothetical protein